jgi:hypothetical protein
VLLNKSQTELVAMPPGLAGTYAIPSSVTEIAPSAFSDCANLTNVTMVAVTDIDSNAFYGCIGFRQVNLPDSVQNIADGAFENCTNLSAITIPNSVTNIGNAAFEGCADLTNAVISDNVVCIGQSAFQGCALTSVTLPDSLTNLGASALSYCPGLTNVTWGVGLTSIASSSFAFAGFQNVSIPFGITNIDSGAFYGCQNLNSIIIPNSVLSIGNEVFEYCYSLTNILLNTNLTSIGVYVFEYCTNLVEITMPGSIVNFGYDDFNYCGNLTTVILGQGIRAFGDGEFYECPNLMNLYFQGSPPSADSFVFHGDTNAVAYYNSEAAGWTSTYDGLPTAPSSVLSLRVTILPAEAIAAGGQWSLDGGPPQNSGAILGNLTQGGHTVSFTPISGWATPPPQTVSITGSAMTFASGSYLPSELEYATNNNDTITVIGYLGTARIVNVPALIYGLPVTSVGANAFQNTTVSDVILPDSITTIGTNAFEGCYWLTNITTSPYLSSIEDGAFLGCTSLGGIAVPSTVTNIGYETFYYCLGLTNFVVDPHNPAYSSLSGVLFDKNELTLIQYPSGNSRGFYAIPDTVLSIGDGAFGDALNLTSITIPASVQAIGNSSFIECEFLTAVNIPNSVSDIGTNAFADCLRLGTASLPDDLSVIPDFLFFGCSSLSNVTIPASVHIVGQYAFNSCTSLTNISIPRDVTQIGGDAFGACSRLTAIMVDSGNAIFTSASGALFDNSTVLAQFPAALGGDYTIPQGVTTIAVGAFDRCANLDNVTLADSVTNIQAEAFQGCENLNGLYFQGNAPSVDASAFSGDYAYAFYLPGPTGWGPTLGNLTAIMLSGLVWNGGFETGDFSFWTLSGDTSYAFVDDGSLSGIAPYAGTYDAILGTSDATGYLSQALQTVPGERYTLSLWMNSPDKDMANQFFVVWNGNIVFNATNIPAIGWTNLQFSLLAPDTNTILELGFRNDNGYFDLDGISVVPTSAASNGALEVILTPTSAIISGAQWQIDNGMFQDSGTIVSNLSLGNHLVSFKALVGWNAQSDEAVTITNNVTTVLTNLYTYAPANFTGINLSGTILQVDGMNGRLGGTYYLLATTNLTQPLSQWQRVATNILGTSGDFTITVTNSGNQAVSERFYMLQTQ